MQAAHHTHRKLNVFPLLRQAHEGVLAVPEGEFAQLVQVVEAPLQGGGAQGPGLLIHPLSQLPAVGIHFGAE